MSATDTLTDSAWEALQRKADALRTANAKLAEELRETREYLQRVYDDVDAPGWIYDGAARLLDLPSLAHGCEAQHEKDKEAGDDK